MNGNLIFVYSMETCPWCKLLKEKLTESNIDFIDRPIEKYAYEYAKFKTVTKNDLVPAMVMMRLPQVLKEDSKADRPYRQRSSGRHERPGHRSLRRRHSQNIH